MKVLLMAASASLLLQLADKDGRATEICLDSCLAIVGARQCVTKLLMLVRRLPQKGLGPPSPLLTHYYWCSRVVGVGLAM